MGGVLPRQCSRAHAAFSTHKHCGEIADGTSSQRWMHRVVEFLQIFIFFIYFSCILYMNVYIGGSQAPPCEILEQKRGGQLCLTIRANNHDFDMPSLEGVTLTRTVAVRRLQ